MRPCLGFDGEPCGVLTTRTRCPLHRRAYDREATRDKREVRPYSSAERDRRLAVVTAWRLTYGDWCPGFNRPGHPASDLCADHIVSVTDGGHEAGPLSVLCRRCNSAKG